MKKVIRTVLCFMLALALPGCGKRPDVKEKGRSDITVIIDNVEHVDTEEAVPVEPDESVIEYVEIPVGGGSAISAFARLEEGKLIVCLIDGEWYRFIATDRVGQP